MYDRLTRPITLVLYYSVYYERFTLITPLLIDRYSFLSFQQCLENIYNHELLDVIDDNQRLNWPVMYHWQSDTKWKSQIIPLFLYTNLLIYM